MRPNDDAGERRMKLGIAGIGKMGAAIAARLIEVGHEVTVWNRAPEKAKAVSAAKIAASPMELAQNSDVVISILTDAAAQDAVYNCPSGLLRGRVTGKLFIDMSTVLPAAEVALAGAVQAKGAAFVECPVGGSTGPARQGNLIGLMGAEPADAARARPILEQLCRRLEHAGPVGSGSVLKFTINLPLMVYWQALGEALAMARSVATDPDRLMDLLSDTSGAASVLKVRAPGIASMLKGGDGGPVTFDIDSAIKDMQAMLAEAKSRGIELPLVERSLACYQETRQQRSGNAEISAVSVYWANRARQ
jgi:3-hydroxyisobutyrate dehydrogenase